MDNKTNDSDKGTFTGDAEATRSDYDAIVVGGGMVGLVAALALARAEFTVAVLEPTLPKKRWPKGFDLRVSAITRASQNVFQALGVWEAMRQKRVSPYTDMQVWDSGGEGEIHFDSALVGQRCLGHIVENRVIQRVLWDALEQQPNAELICPAEALNLQVAPAYAELEVVTGRRLRAPVVVAADGTRSSVRQQCGIAVTAGSYGQCALVATVRTHHSHRQTAWQRFLPSGPLAFLPLADNYSSIVWSTTEAAATALVAMDDEAFALALADALGHKLGAIEAVSERQIFPLQHLHAKQYVKPRISLIGDAAHTIHPLAGQGVNLGIADAASLVDVIRRARDLGQDWGSYAVLRCYERWRKGDNTLTLNSMTGFKQLFGASNPWLVSLRNTGLTQSDRFDSLKRIFIQQAMGFCGELPSLAVSRPEFHADGN